MKTQPTRLEMLRQKRDLLRQKRDLLTLLLAKQKRDHRYVLAKIRKTFADELRRALQ